MLQQQEKFENFIQEYNFERPHEALDMKCPAELYTASTQVYGGLPDIEYPLHDKTITVTRCGRICMGGRKINFSRVFAEQDIGVKQVEDKIWKVSFMHYDLGYFDEEVDRVEPGPNPFGPVRPETSFTFYTGDIVYTFSNQEGFQWVGGSVARWMRSSSL